MSRVLVTGASGGIGAAICTALARRGVTVLLHYRSNRSVAEATRQALAAAGHGLIQANLGDPDSIEQLWREAAARQSINAVVDNAGIYSLHSHLATDNPNWTAAWPRTVAPNPT